MTNRDYDSAVNRAARGEVDQEPTQPIKKIPGRVKQEKTFWYRAKREVNRALEEGLPAVVRDKTCRLLGEGPGNLAADLLLLALDRIGYGAGKSTPSNYSSSFASQQSGVNYVASYRQNRQPQQQIGHTALRLDWKRITTMTDQSQANELLHAMQTTIALHGYITVGQLLQIQDMENDEEARDPAVNVLGWSNLSNVQIRRSNLGWWLDLPVPVEVRRNT